MTLRQHVFTSACALGRCGLGPGTPGGYGATDDTPTCPPDDRVKEVRQMRTVRHMQVVLSDVRVIVGHILVLPSPLPTCAPSLSAEYYTQTVCPVSLCRILHTDRVPRFSVHNSTHRPCAPSLGAKYYSQTLCPVSQCRILHTDCVPRLSVQNTTHRPCARLSVQNTTRRPCALSLGAKYYTQTVCPVSQCRILHTDRVPRLSVQNTTHRPCAPSLSAEYYTQTVCPISQCRMLHTDRVPRPVSQCRMLHTDRVPRPVSQCRMLHTDRAPRPVSQCRMLHTDRVPSPVSQCRMLHTDRAPRPVSQCRMLHTDRAPRLREGRREKSVCIMQRQEMEKKSTQHWMK